MAVAAVKNTGVIQRSIGKFLHGNIEILQPRHMFSGWSRIKEADTDKPFTEIKGTEFDPVGTAAGDHHFIGSGEGETEAFHIHFAFFDLETDLRRTGRRIDPAVADGFSQILFHKHGGFQTSLIFIRHQFNDHFSVFDDRERFTTCRIHCKKQ